MADQRYFPKDMTGKLAHVAEECGEVIQMVSKCIRFGVTEVYPKQATRKNNAARLLDEMADLEGSLSRLRVELEPLAKIDGGSIKPEAAE